MKQPCFLWCQQCTYWVQGEITRLLLNDHCSKSFRTLQVKNLQIWFLSPLKDSGGICFLHAISKLNIHTKHPNTQHATNSQCKIGQWKLWENLQWYRNYNELSTYSMNSVKTSNKFVWVKVLVRKTREFLEMWVYSADRKSSLEA